MRKKRLGRLFKFGAPGSDLGWVWEGVEIQINWFEWVNIHQI